MNRNEIYVKFGRLVVNDMNITGTAELIKMCEWILNDTCDYMQNRLGQAFGVDNEIQFKNPFTGNYVHEYVELEGRAMRLAWSTLQLIKPDAKLKDYGLEIEYLQ